MSEEGWNGPMTGPQRGHPLVQCPTHTIWFEQPKGCPVCNAIKAVDRLCQRLAVVLQVELDSTKSPDTHEALLVVRGIVERECHATRHAMEGL
jgi:hypothetical protein